MFLNFFLFTERKRYRDCFMYTRGLTSEFPSLAKLNLNSSQYKNLRADQRISVISNTSSNTTSGIVSDRVQSLDESEGKIWQKLYNPNKLYSQLAQLTATLPV